MTESASQDGAPGRGIGLRNEETRRHNLSVVLRAVHMDGPISSAELTRRSKLNRSTVRTLVGELVDAGLAYETAPLESGTVGRPSPQVNASTSIAAIAVNPDVDAVTVGVVGLGGTLLATRTEPLATIPSPTAAAEVASRVARALVAGMERQTTIIGAGIAVPGLVREGTGEVVRAPHLGWRGEQVAEVFSATLGVPVRVGNDAALGLIAERRFGSGRGTNDIIYLNGSTSGIGGGAFSSGRLVAGADGFGAELGHTVVAGGVQECECGRRGCLETEVNIQRLDRARGGPHEPGAYDVEIPAAGPALAAEVDRQARVLASAIANLIGVFNPRLVILGGFLGSLLDAREADVRAAIKAEAFAPLADEVVVARTTLRESLLMVGAAELAFAPLLADPLGWRRRKA